MIDQEWVRVALARVHARNDALKLYNWKVAVGLERGELNPADASAMKVFGTELRVVPGAVLCGHVRAGHDPPLSVLGDLVLD